MGGSGAFIVNFEHISHLFLVFPLLTLNIICWNVFAECIQSRNVFKVWSLKAFQVCACQERFQT